METKKCIKCGIEFPKTSEYFQMRSDRKSGVENKCKKCGAIDKREYSRINSKYMTEKSRLWNVANREKRKQYLQDSKLKIKAQRKQYRQENKENISKYIDKYRQINEINIKTQRKVYVKKHLEYFRMVNQKRRTFKLQLPATLTIEQWESIKNHFNDKCCYCGKELPLAQEHFIPVTKGGEYSLNNIIPSCKSCNSSKGNRDFKAWYSKYRYYSKKREKIILEYLGYSDKVQQLKII